MKQLILFSIIFCLLFIPYINPQNNGNIPLMFKGKFNREAGVGDVWGVQINGINYALVTLDGGLSIVNTNDPYNPSEIVHINHEDYHEPPDFTRLGIPDVETFTFGSITYAYLATYKTNDVFPNPSFPLVMIINLNAAIAEALQNPLPYEILVDPYNPSGNVYVGKIDDFGEIDVSHTLTIGGHYLYVATLNDSLPVWDLNSSPASPAYLGFVTVNPSYSSIHEIYAKPLTGQSVRVFVASLIGGLQILDLSYIPMKDGSTQIQNNNAVEHTYDFDRAYPNQRWSPFPFDHRFTHSVVPTDNEQYVFTTDELEVNWKNPDSQYSALDPNLFSSGTLKSPRREGAFLRVWDKSLLGQDASFKGGYYVSEEHHWGITDLTQIDTTMVPNSIHQMVVRGNRMYLAHYTQGFRYLDISDPENIIELGYYDDFPSINFNPASDYFFRKTGNWHKGIYGVFPDPNRTTICYAGGDDGFYIFDLLAIPYPPTNLTVEANPQNNYVLSWTPSQTLNVQYYNIYRADVPNDPPYDLPFYIQINATEEGNPITSWEDVNSYPGQGGGNYYYQISVVTTFERESVQSNRVNATKGGIDKKSAEEEGENFEIFEYSLSDNYPNPFNPTTQINFSIEKAGIVIIKVYDLLGKEVANLVDERKEPGNYSVNFNAENLPSGVYVYKLTSGNYVASKKLLLLK